MMIRSGLLAFALGFALMLALLGGRAPAHGRVPVAERPGVWFCLRARQFRALFNTDQEAEDAARTRGATEETIRRARLCVR